MSQNIDEDRMRLREALNVHDLKQRDCIVRRIRTLRAHAVLDKHTFEYWNRLHPTEPPIDTSLWDAIILWCDGKGPLPPEARERANG